MRRPSRPLFVAFLACVLVLGAVPASAFGAVTLTWVMNWGTFGTADGQFKFPPDVAADKWGNVYAAGGENGDDRVQMFDGNGTYVKSVGVLGSGVQPRTVTTDRWGTIYVGEKGNGATVRLYDPLLYSEIGTFQESPGGTISGPANLAVALDGTVYVADEGTLLQRWRYRSFVDQRTPAGISTFGLGVTQDGVVLTTTGSTSGITHSVVAYDAAGVYLDAWGGYGTAPGQFNQPYDVGADPLGNVYVIESEGQRGQVFTADGGYVTTFGSAGSGDQQFYLPYGMAVGLDRTLYVADTFNNRISKWKVAVPTVVASVAGDSRITTAVEASKKAYPSGAKTVVLATAANWPDALGGAALAGTVKGPLLLVNKDTLPTAVGDEIVRLHATGIYVLGGTSAVSDAVLNAAKALTPLGAAERLGGANRYETANKIATKVIALKNVAGGYDGTAFVCTGLNFPDALAASPIAAANGWPIYLTAPGALTATTRAAMLANNSIHGYIVGSTGAVSTAVAAGLEDMSPLPVQAFSRYGGANRYETAAMVAAIGYEGMGMLWSRPAIATGENFPDALAGGVLQGSDYSVLLLTQKSSLPAATAAALAANRDMIYELRFLGGTASISTAVRTGARALLW